MKIKLGVFFGGESVEHEVSIISAIQAINNMDTVKYDIIPVYITKESTMYVGEKIGNIESYKDIPKLLSESQQVILIREDNKVKLIKYPMKKFGKNEYDYIDVAFPIVHGTNVEDGALQGYFKTLKIPFVGCDVTSSAVGMDKYIMKTVLKYNDIPVLDGQIYGYHEYEEDAEELMARIEKEIAFPLIVKPVNLGSSVGIKIARDKKELAEALEYAFTFAKKILIERAVMNLREINCSVLGDFENAIASECEEPIGTDEILSYEDKYISNGSKSGSKGMSSLKRKLPADLTKEMKEKIQTLAVKTFKVLGCNGVSRIDFIIENNEDVYVNEINTIPGSLSFYLWNATGMDYKEQLSKMVDLALKRAREEKDISYTFETNILSGIKLDGIKGTKMGK
ncbi:MAG: D-alanine--D-alanine ligase [Clostridiales bacterium]|nr:D-alanine--D-alanine ligase [Clostridiales bacterium]